MPTSAELRSLKRRYVDLRNDANAVLAHLNNCNNMADICNSKLSLGFQIDESNPDNNKISDMKSSISNMKEKLSTLVIPSLDSKIKEIETMIRNAESAEAAESNGL